MALMAAAELETIWLRVALKASMVAVEFDDNEEEGSPDSLGPLAMSRNGEDVARGESFVCAQQPPSAPS